MSITTDNRIPTNADYPVGTAPAEAEAAAVEERRSPIPPLNPEGRTAKLEVGAEFAPLEISGEEGSDKHLFSGQLNGEFELFTPTIDLEKWGQKSGFVFKGKATTPFGFTDGYLNKDSKQALDAEARIRITVLEGFVGYNNTQKYDETIEDFGKQAGTFRLGVMGRYFDPRIPIDIKYPLAYGSLSFEGVGLADFNKFNSGAGGNVFLLGDTLYLGADVAFSQQRKDQRTFFGERFFDFDYTPDPEEQEALGYVWYHKAKAEGRAHLLLGKTDDQIIKNKDGSETWVRAGHRYGLTLDGKLESEWDMDARPDPESQDPANDDFTEDYTLGDLSADKLHGEVNVSFYWAEKVTEKKKVNDPDKPGEKKDVPVEIDDPENPGKKIQIQHYQSIKEVREDGPRHKVSVGYTTDAEKSAGEWLGDPYDTSEPVFREITDTRTHALMFGYGYSGMNQKLVIGRDLLAFSVDPEVGVQIPIGDPEKSPALLFKLTVKAKKSIPIKVGE